MGATLMEPYRVQAVFGVKPEEAHAKVASLTPREKQVALLIARGWSNHEVAAGLNISPKTLDIHRAKVRMKLGCEQNGIASIVYTYILTSQDELPAYPARPRVRKKSILAV